MSVRRFCNGLAVALMLAAGSADAQQLSDRQLVASLRQVAGEAPAIDLGMLVQEVNANVGQGMAGLPNWGQLANLAQLAVEIDFENNSVAIMPESYRTIGLIADALHNPELRHYKFLVVGHTNATGKAEHNLELSMQRADAIRAALTTTFAIEPKRLVAIGVGQELPLDSTNPTSPANRRVQLINLGAVE